MSEYDHLEDEAAETRMGRRQARTSSRVASRMRSGSRTDTARRGETARRRDTTVATVPRSGDRRASASRAAHSTVRRPPRIGRGSRSAAWRVLVGVLLTLIVLGGIGAAVARYLLYRPDVDVAGGEPVHVVIDQGSTTTEIAEALASAGVIDNALMFRLQARLAEADGDLRAGEYDLTTGMSYDDVLKALAAGPPPVYVEVTIPEGFTASQVAERIASETSLPLAELMVLVSDGAPRFAMDHPYLTGAYGDSLEGYLFPATYRIEPDMSATDTVEMMLDTFDAQIASVDLSYAESRELDMGDVVIIASILEREAQLAEEFPLVSSVIYNRLALPMRLQLCATVMYTMPEGTTALTNADLEQETPYNTYLHDGLPVGPISNPGLAALQAAAQPAQTKYLYYVLTGDDGSQTFTETYDEFLRAKQAAQ